MPTREAVTLGPERAARKRARESDNALRTGFVVSRGPAGWGRSRCRCDREMGQLRCAVVTVDDLGDAGADHQLVRAV